MHIHLCSTCNRKPHLQPYELGITYSFICPKCGKETPCITSRNATLDNPYCDKETKERLIIEWNQMNKIKPFQVGI